MGLMCLMFLKLIVCCSLTLNSCMWMIKITGLWSEMGESMMASLSGMTSVQQIKSRMWPLLWVGRLTMQE